jgi:ATP/maltotriose-dependent transcriptional regulator MalT
VVLPSNHRAVIEHQLLSETRRSSLHRQAATVCQMRGLYTEATYHLVRAGDASTAILQWQEHKQPEINQGQATAALAIFHEIRSLQIELGEKAQGWLASLCGELEYLRGDVAQALHELEPLLSSESVMGVQAHNLVGVIENDRSNFPAAARSRQGVA